MIATFLAGVRVVSSVSVRRDVATSMTKLYLDRAEARLVGRRDPMLAERAARPDRERPPSSRQSLRVIPASQRRAACEAAAKVYIVDDDEGIRDSLQRLLRSVDQPVEAFASAREFLSVWNAESVCVLVLDIRMPDMSGMALQERLAEMHSTIPIIFITGYGDVPTAVRAMQKGAFDFVSKPFRSQDMLETIQRALETSVRARQAELLRQRESERIARLTRREQQILELMVEGKANKVMAADLGLSQRTIEVHRANAMKKLGVDSLAAAIRAVLIARGGRGAVEAGDFEADDANQA